MLIYMTLLWARRNFSCELLQSRSVKLFRMQFIQGPIHNSKLNGSLVQVFGTANDTSITSESFYFKPYTRLNWPDVYANSVTNDVLLRSRPRPKTDSTEHLWWKWYCCILWRLRRINLILAQYDYVISFHTLSLMSPRLPCTSGYRNLEFNLIL